MKGARRDTPATTTLKLRALVRQYRGLMALLAALSLIGAVLEAVFLVIITGTGLALVQGNESVGPVAGRSFDLTTALVGAGVVLAARLALNLGVVWTSASLAKSVTADQRDALADAYTRTSWAVQQAEPAGMLQALMVNFVGGVIGSLTALTSAITAALSLVAFLGIGVVIDPLSTVSVLGVLLILGGVLAPIRRRVRRRAGANAVRSLEFAHGVSELGELGLEMQVFGVQSRFAERLRELTRREVQSSFRVRTLSGSLSPLYTFLAYATLLGGVGALLLIGGGAIDIASLGAIILLMLRSLSYGQNLQAAAGTIASSRPYLERIAATLERYRDAATGTGTIIPSAIAPLQLQGVGFSYVPDRPALTGVDLTIGEGEIVGVIGPSGSGKSTLAQLLMGLREPTTGSLSVSGVELRDVDRTWWTRRVAFVSQDAHLFTGTVADNIRFFRDGIDDAALRRAATLANVLADIERLPQGFDTHLGERGSQLSGGQRQRISIARALAGEPEMIVLDEPTSALDGESEALIRATLADLHGRVTVVVIAHRLSTLDICDRIVVIEDGRMTAADTPEILRQDSHYFRSALASAGLT